MPHRTSTFPGRRKVDFHRFFVKIRLKCLLKSVFQRPLSAAGVVAGALPSFSLHAKSHGTIRQSTGSQHSPRRELPAALRRPTVSVPDLTQHANKAASLALYYTTLGDKEGGQAWLCHPTTPISFDTGIAKPSIKALLAQSHGSDSTEHRLSTPTPSFSFSFSFSHGTKLPLNTHKGSALMYTRDLP
ncbi:hypothetical protein BDW02DRAFT_216090 [Decorospora gaudefroyi]|uniref:Uncharacterized protein n=1 Tax=Decorospora gaudefroyi TaxID=184978 RepID=A0A6A5JY86_9PLEO|nr:hypothetical protein BDW02DRAFT_216090 [Decorospora gaudefroyi]